MAQTPLDGSPRHVLVIVEDPALGELLLEALEDAGHSGEVTNGDPAEISEIAAVRSNFDAAIVDLDTRARSGATIVGILRALCPSMTVIALLPCGGLSVKDRSIPFHVSVEKPARLRSLLVALTLSPP